MLINLSNHPYAQWSDTQKQEARLFGDCVDLPFPLVEPMGDEKYIEALVDEYHNHILELRRQSNSEIVVHLMGEMTFVYGLLERLRQDNIRCIASTTERQTIDKGNGQKESQFEFSRFRNYF